MIQLILLLLLVDLSELIIQLNQSTIVRLAVITCGVIAMRGRELIFILFYCLITTISLAVVSLEDGELIPELLGRSRLLLFPMAMAVGLKFPTRDKTAPPYVGSIIIVVLVLNIGASLLGFGMTQYGLTADGTPIAVKGAYSGGNEVSVMYALAVIFLVHRSSFRAVTYGSVVVLASVGVGLWLGTKTAVCFSLIAALTLARHTAVTLLAALKTSRLRSSRYLLPSIALIALVGAMLLSSNIGIGSRLNVLTAKLANDYAKVEDLGSVASSGRLALADNVGRAYLEQVTPVSLALGFGWMGGQKLHPDLQNKQIESDPLDLAIAFGILGVGLIYGYWVLLLIATMRRRESTMTVAIITLLFLSIIPGHVMYSSLAPLVLGLVLGQRLGKQKLASKNGI